MRKVSYRHCCYGVIICCLLVALSGCRNRGVCGGNCFSSNGPFANQTTIAAPATYSLNIPGSQNALTANGSGTTNQPLVRQATNTQPITNGVNVQNGWVPAGSTSNSTIQGSQSTLPPSNTSSGVNIQTPQNRLQNRNQIQTPNQTQLVNVNPLNNNGSNTRANLASQTNGLSFTEATNFRSTAVDERLDQSRLPVTDASQVRAPTRFSPTTSVGQFSAPYYVPQQQVANVPQYNNVNNNRLAAVPQYPQAVQPNGQITTSVGAFGQPTFGQPSQQPYRGLATQSPQVLAQSTVYADPSVDPNFQNASWRDRDLTAARDQFNR